MHCTGHKKHTATCSGIVPHENDPVLSISLAQLAYFLPRRNIGKL